LTGAVGELVLTTQKGVPDWATIMLLNDHPEVNTLAIPLEKSGSV
jgi:hypothetical protein